MQYVLPPSLLIKGRERTRENLHGTVLPHPFLKREGLDGRGYGVIYISLMQHIFDN